MLVIHCNFPPKPGLEIHAFPLTKSCHDASPHHAFIIISRKISSFPLSNYCIIILSATPHPNPRTKKPHNQKLPKGAFIYTSFFLLLLRSSLAVTLAHFACHFPHLCACFTKGLFPPYTTVSSSPLFSVSFSLS